MEPLSFFYTLDARVLLRW